MKTIKTRCEHEKLSETPIIETRIDYCPFCGKEMNYEPMMYIKDGLLRLTCKCPKCFKFHQKVYRLDLKCIKDGQFKTIIKL